MAEAFAIQGRNAWLDRFASDPAGELDALLRGVRQVPPYYRADAGDVLSLLIAPPPGDAELREALDEALLAWLADRRREGPEHRTRYGVARHVGELTEALSLVYRLKLPRSAQALFRDFDRYDGWLAVLDLGPGYRPHREFLRAVAEGQQDRGLRALWLELCAAAAGEDDNDDLLDIALVGLKKLPGNDHDASREMLFGVAAFGRALPVDQLHLKNSRRRFLGRWRAVKQLYPRTPNYWDKILAPVLDKKAQHPDNGNEVFADWWRAEENFSTREQAKKLVATLPPRDELKKLLRDIGRANVQEIQNRTLQLIEKYRTYVEATGDDYYLVRSARALASPLIDHDPALALHLVRIAREWAPNDEYLWTIWGRALAAFGHPDLAELVLWEATRRFPDNVVSRNALAGLLHDAGRSTEAEALYRDTAARFPDNDVSRNALAGLLHDAGRSTEAEALYRDTAARFPNDAVCRNALGLLLIDLGRWQEAEPLLADLHRLGAGREIAELAGALKRAQPGEAVCRPDRPSPDAAAAGTAAEAELPPRVKRGARLTRADFRLGPALDRIAAEDAEPLRAEARAEVEAAVGDDPNDPYARLVHADRLGGPGAIGEALLDAMPHDLPLHLIAALNGRDAALLHRMSEEFAEERRLVLLGLVAIGAADDEHQKIVARWLARPQAPSEDLRHLAVRASLSRLVRRAHGLGEDEAFDADAAGTVLTDPARQTEIEQDLRRAARAPAR